MPSESQDSNQISKTFPGNIYPDWEEKLEEATEYLEKFPVILIEWNQFEFFCKDLGLTAYQKHFLRRRWLAVEMIAQRMSINMSKGILKYINQDGTAEYWAEMGFDDLIDAANYKAIEAFERDNPDDDIPAPPTYNIR